MIKGLIATFLLISLASAYGRAPEALRENLTHSDTDHITQLVKDKLLLENVDYEKLGSIGFTPLIQENLDSWKTYNATPAVSFSLEDGIISGKATNLKGNSFLYTAQEYGNFLLYFEFRFDHLNGNSGLMYRSQYQGEKLSGLQYEMDNGDKKQGVTTRQWSGLLYAEKAGGWLYPNRDKKIGDREKASREWLAQLTKEGHATLNKTGWNAGFIRLKGTEIQTWLNGVLRTDFKSEDPAFPLKGMIALQMHGGKACAASWRNLYILPLKAAD